MMLREVDEISSEEMSFQMNLVTFSSNFSLFVVESESFTFFNILKNHSNHIVQGKNCQKN